MGDVHWELIVCLLIAWVLLYGTIRKSVRWSGNLQVDSTVPDLFYSTKLSRKSGLPDSHSAVRPLVSVNRSSVNIRWSWWWIALFLLPGLVAFAQSWGETSLGIDFLRIAIHIRFSSIVSRLNVGVGECTGASFYVHGYCVWMPYGFRQLQPLSQPIDSRRPMPESTQLGNVFDCRYHRFRRTWTHRPRSGRAY